MVTKPIGFFEESTMRAIGCFVVCIRRSAFPISSFLIHVNELLRIVRGVRIGDEQFDDFDILSFAGRDFHRHKTNFLLSGEILQVGNTDVGVSNLVTR